MQANILPEYHFLRFAPNLGAEYFFDGARNYWNTFKPIVINDVAILRLLPPAVTVSVTVVALRDLAAQIGVELGQIAPFAYYDAVVYDTFESTRAELNRRAQLNQPFGVPMGIGIATTTPFIPTPWLPTRPPGFITATPDPAVATPEITDESSAEVTPETGGTASPTPTATLPGQVINTPGPAIGG
ncbi:MAG: hypothetical protein IAE89_09980 [Anaerolineae bacterium]|nr:hypothetical protein [Anaerolineae bacterium]